MASYLEQLTGALLEGVVLLPESLRNESGDFFLSRQRDDGGFAGREGGSDLYYTGFALRALAILGKLNGSVADDSANFLKRRLSGRESVVDLFSLVYASQLLEFFADVDVFADVTSDWKTMMAQMLAELRRPDGGYAKAHEGQASSTYHTFLVLLCLQAIGAEIPEPQAILRFLLSQRAENGGFREIRVSKRAGSNPTAAAIGSLDILQALDADTADQAAEFLADMQTDEGGFRANTRIPIADVLSTFTSLVTLRTIQAWDHPDIDLSAVARFVRSLYDGGGFLAAAWDEVVDVEYTFYGLGSLALIAREHAVRSTNPSTHS